MIPTLSVNINQQTHLEVRYNYQEAVSVPLTKKWSSHGPEEFSVKKRMWKNGHTGGLRLVKKKLDTAEDLGECAKRNEQTREDVQEAQTKSDRELQKAIGRTKQHNRSKGNVVITTKKLMTLQKLQKKGQYVVKCATQNQHQSISAAHYPVATSSAGCVQLYKKIEPAEVAQNAGTKKGRREKLDAKNQAQLKYQTVPREK